MSLDWRLLDLSHHTLSQVKLTRLLINDNAWLEKQTETDSLLHTFRRFIGYNYSSRRKLLLKHGADIMGPIYTCISINTQRLLSLVTRTRTHKTALVAMGCTEFVGTVLHVHLLN